MLKRFSYCVLLMAVLFAASTVHAVVWTAETIPNPRLADFRQHVSDPDNLLDAVSKDSINELLTQTEADNTAEIAVVALQSIGDVDITDFRTILFNQWKIGKAQKDNGLLILFVADQKKVTIETGYGMEGLFPDAICFRIINQDMVPIMQTGRYGEGLLNGVKAFVNDLKDPAAAAEVRATEIANQAAANAASKDVFLTKAKRIGLGYLALSVLILIISVLIVRKRRTEIEMKPVAASGTKANADANANTDIEANTNTDIEANPNPNPNQSTKLVKVAALPLAPYLAYKTMATGKGAFTVLTYIFPLTMVFFTLWYNLRLRKLRRMPRACPTCSHPLKRMNEKQEDAYLSSGQQSEENVGSIDYDVWVCMDCSHREVLPYGETFTRYKNCPSCGYKTYAQVRDHIVLPPTPISPGKGERVYQCNNCQHTVRKEYIIPMIIVPVGGGRGGGFGGGGGGGFGGGSFGGGMSGGGGATGGWR